MNFLWTIFKKCAQRVFPPGGTHPTPFRFEPITNLHFIETQLRNCILTNIMNRTVANGFISQERNESMLYRINTFNILKKKIYINMLFALRLHSKLDQLLLIYFVLSIFFSYVSILWLIIVCLFFLFLFFVFHTIFAFFLSLVW